MKLPLFYDLDRTTDYNTVIQEDNELSDVREQALDLLSDAESNPSVSDETYIAMCAFFESCRTVNDYLIFLEER